MESQNVSAQLYFKQLSPEAGNAASDSNIETAFQKQLDLSEFYKQKNVFEMMKKDYMDQTMEGSVTPPPEVPVVVPESPSITPTPINKKVGPRDFINKSTFGASSSRNIFTLTNLAIFIMLCVILYWVFYLIKKVTTKKS